MFSLVATEIVRGAMGILKDKASKQGYALAALIFINQFIEKLSSQIPLDYPDDVIYYGIWGVLIGVLIVIPVSWFEGLGKKVTILKRIFNKEK